MTKKGISKRPYTKLRTFMWSNSITIKGLADESLIDRTTIGGWFKNRSTPSKESVDLVVEAVERMTGEATSPEDIGL